MMAARSSAGKKRGGRFTPKSVPCLGYISDNTLSGAYFTVSMGVIAIVSTSVIRFEGLSEWVSLNPRGFFQRFIKGKTLIVSPDEMQELFGVDWYDKLCHALIEYNQYHQSLMERRNIITNKLSKYCKPPVYITKGDKILNKHTGEEVVFEMVDGKYEVRKVTDSEPQLRINLEECDKRITSKFLSSVSV
jgi:hypothetical protein